MCIYQKISLCTQAQNAVFDALSSLFWYWSLDEISKQIGVEYAVLVQVMAREEVGSDVVESLAEKLGLKAMSQFTIHDLVVSKNKLTKPILWKVEMVSQLFEKTLVCYSESELLRHFEKNELRHATQEEIDAGRRLP